MSDRPRVVSAPPSPPDDYLGPEVDLVGRGGRRTARLSVANDAVVVELDGHRHTAGDTQEIERLLRCTVDYSTVRPIVRERPWATRREHAVLLLFLAAHWSELYQHDGLKYHLTLSYALPLALDKSWQVWVEQHAELLLDAGQLVAVPAANLLAVQPDIDISRHHRRLLRPHTLTVVQEHRDIARYLDDWSRFSIRRYGVAIPDSELEALRAVLAMSNCVVRNFVHRDSLIGCSVVCWHARCNIWFDLMATWESEAARLRPGIYSGVYNMLDAQKRGARYSLCYGQFSYKEEIVGKSKRLTIYKLQSSSEPSPGVSRG